MFNQQTLWNARYRRLHFLLLRRLDQSRTHISIEEKIGGEHVACYRSQEELIREIAEEMGISLP